MEAITEDPELLELVLYGIRENESRHLPGVKNNPKSGAEGRMQVKRRLFDMSNEKGLPPGYGIPALKKGADAMEVEAYGRLLFERYVSMYGNVRDALVAYNLGPAGANKWIQGGRKMSALPKETRGYIAKATEVFERELAKPPEERMEYGRTVSLPLGQITVPPPPPPPAPPEKLDPSKAGMALKAENDLARFHDEPGLAEKYAKADATMAAEQALEDRGPRPAEQEPAPTTGGIGFFGYDTGTAEGLLEQARRFLRASRPVVRNQEDLAEPPSMVPFPYQDGGEVDLATIAAGGSGPTEEQRRGVGSLADQARGMFSADGATNVARSVLGQGLMMGWGDEAEAYVRSRYTGRPYEEVLAEIRAENEEYNKRNPYGAVIGEVAGGMLPTAAALALTPVTGGASLPAAFMGPAGRYVMGRAMQVPVAYGAGIGATQGFISGAGSAEEGDRLSEGAIGGGIGGAFGAAVPYGVQRYLRRRERLAREAGSAEGMADGGEVAYGFDPGGFGAYPAPYQAPDDVMAGGSATRDVLKGVGSFLGNKIKGMIPESILDRYQARLDRQALERAAAQVPDDSAYEPLRQRLVDEGIITQAVKPPGGSWVPHSIQNMVNMEAGVNLYPQRSLQSQKDYIADLEKTIANQKSRDVSGYPPKARREHDEILRDNEQELVLAREELSRLTKRAPVDEWFLSTFKNYVQNKMGTVDDPVIDLIERTKKIPGVSEDAVAQGTRAIDREMDQYASIPLDRRSPVAPHREGAFARRERQGYNWAGEAISPEARYYEYITDSMIVPYRAGDPEMARRASDVTDFLAPVWGEVDPALSKQTSKWLEWMNKADPDSTVYEFNRSGEMRGILGAVRGALADSIDEASALPKDLQLRPEALKRMSVEDAFDHATKVLAHQEEVTRKAQLELLRANSRVDVPEFNLSFVEKPGGSWVDLPDVEKSSQNLKGCTALGQAGGWCTQNKGDAVGYGSGANRLHVLVDGDGRPHVQVASISKGKDMPRDIYEIKPPENKIDSRRVRSYEDKDPDYVDKIQQATLKFLNSGEWGNVDRGEIENIVGSRGAIIDLNAHLSRVVDAETGKLLSREFSPNNFSGRLVREVKYGREFGTKGNPIDIRKSYPEEGDARAALAQAATELAGKDRFMLEEPLVDRARAILGLPVSRADGGEMVAPDVIPDEGIGTLADDAVMEGGSATKDVVKQLGTFLSRAAKSGETVGMFSGKAVNAERLPEEVSPKDVLVLMACGGQKIHTSQPTSLTGLYCGPMWQTLMSRKGNIDNSQIHVLSGEHGLVPGSTKSLPYEKVLTPEKSAEVLDKLPDTQQQFVRPDGRPWGAVIIAGGGKYRDTFEEVVARLKDQGLVDPSAAVVATRGGIGDQRKALGEYLKQANTVPQQKADGGEVSKGIGSMVGVARNMTRRAA